MVTKLSIYEMSSTFDRSLSLHSLWLFPYSILLSWNDNLLSPAFASNLILLQMKKTIWRFFLSDTVCLLQKCITLYMYVVYCEITMCCRGREYTLYVCLFTLFIMTYFYWHVFVFKYPFLVIRNGWNLSSMFIFVV